MFTHLNTHTLIKLYFSQLHPAEKRECTTPPQKVLKEQTV